MIEVPDHESCNFTFHFRLAYCNIRPEYLSQILAFLLSVFETVEVFLTETLLFVVPVVVHLVGLRVAHFVGAWLLHSHRHPILHHLRVGVCVPDAVHHLHAVVALHHALGHPLRHPLRHALGHPLWHPLRHALRHAHVALHVGHALGHVVHGHHALHALHGHALHLHALRHVGHALHVHHLALLHLHLHAAVLLHAGLHEALVAHLLLHHRVDLLPTLPVVGLDGRVQLVFALLLAHQVRDLERFAHEHLAVHVFERFQGVLGLLEADVAEAAVHLLLLVSFLHIFDLDFGRGDRPVDLEFFLKHFFVYRIIDEFDLQVVFVFGLSVVVFAHFHL